MSLETKYHQLTGLKPSDLEPRPCQAWLRKQIKQIEATQSLSPNHNGNGNREISSATIVFSNKTRDPLTIFECEYCDGEKVKYVVDRYFNDDCPEQTLKEILTERRSQIIDSWKTGTQDGSWYKARAQEPF